MATRQSRLLPALALGLVLALPTALAEDRAAPSPRALELARTMFDQADIFDEAMHELTPVLAQQLQDQLRDQGKHYDATVTTAFAEEFAGAMSPRFQGFVDEVVPVVAATFTEEEMAAIVAFYGSPVGKSVMAKMPAYLAEVMTRLGPWMQAVLPGALAEVKTRMSARGIAMPE